VGGVWEEGGAGDGYGEGAQPPPQDKNISFVMVQ